MSLATDTFKKFTNTYNDIAYESISDFCDFVLAEIYTIKESYYDVISGLAGSMIYLVKCPENKKRNFTIIKSKQLFRIDYHRCASVWQCYD